MDKQTKDFELKINRMSLWQPREEKSSKKALENARKIESKLWKKTGSKDST